MARPLSDSALPPARRFAPPPFLASSLLGIAPSPPLSTTPFISMTTVLPVRSLWAPDPSPRPTSPSTRFAPTLGHSATWASPRLRTGPPSACASLVRLCPSPVFTSPSLTVLQLHRRASTRDTARRLRQHRPAHAVRLAALVVGAAAPRSLRPLRASLSPASASRPPPVSSPLKATPAACSARLPSPPSVLPAACCRPRRSPQRSSTRP